MQQLQVKENVVGFEKALGAAEVIKDQIQYRSQSLLNLARDYFRPGFHYTTNATTTTQKQSDYRVEQSSFTLIALF